MCTDLPNGLFRVAMRGEVPVVEAENLSVLDWLVHGFCGRRGGVSEGPYESLNTSVREGDTLENVERNRLIVARALTVETSPFFPLRQVHGDRVVVIDGPVSLLDPFVPAVGDAVITSHPAMALCIRTADCVPLFIVDPDQRVIADVHAGWRGTALDIAGRVVATMVSRFGSRASRLLAAIGPAIGHCCYEVDEEVIDAMGAWAFGSSLVPSSRPKHWMLDLQAINRRQLLDRGLLAERIATIPLCTFCRQDLFFSHRRDGRQTGRQANILMIRKSLT